MNLGFLIRYVKEDRGSLETSVELREVSVSMVFLLLKSADYLPSTQCCHGMTKSIERIQGNPKS